MNRKQSSILIIIISTLFMILLLFPVKTVKNFTTKPKLIESYDKDLSYIYMISGRDYDYLLENKGDIDTNKVRIKSFVVKNTNGSQEEVKEIKKLYGKDSITLKELNEKLKDPNVTLKEYNKKEILVKKSLLGVKSAKKVSDVTYYSVDIKSPHMKLTPDDVNEIKLMTEKRIETLIFDRLNDVDKEDLY